MPGITRKETTIDTAFESQGEETTRLQSIFEQLRTEAAANHYSAGIILREAEKLVEDLSENE